MKKRFFKDSEFPHREKDGLEVIPHTDGVVGFTILDFRDPERNNFAGLSRKQVLQLIAYLQKVIGETTTKRRRHS